jgi:Tol biopolymer transport system component/outer membrane protein OmpA-like peptidoglycan-associated protein
MAVSRGWRSAVGVLAVVVAFAIAFAAGVAAAQESSSIQDLTQLTSGKETDLYPNVSADGKRLVFQRKASGSAPFGLFTWKIGDAAAPTAISEGKSSDENPRWIGELPRLVFDSDRLPETRLVWWKDLEGMGQTAQLSAGGTFDFQADATRDGERVVFCSLAKAKLKSPKGGADRIALFADPKALPEIKVLDLTQKALFPVGTGTTGVNPTWDPKGQRIAYASNVTGNYEVYVVNADGTNPQQVTSFEGPDVEPTWSPDGLYLAFARLTGKNWNLWMVELATGKQTQLTIDPAMDGGPSWGPDGKIFFHSDRGGSWDVWSLKPAGYRIFVPEKPKVLDSDGDGLLDPDDRCVMDAEDKDGFEDEDGCPDPDNDGDGLNDDVDRCPRDRETKNGFQDADGCPDETPIKDRMVLFGVIFKAGNAELEGSSIPFLNAFADLMKEDAAAVVEIRGYVDGQTEKKNAQLSQRRAETVMQYLLLKGIAASRMKAVGMGSADPLCADKTPECQARNRRIEIARGM